MPLVPSGAGPQGWVPPPPGGRGGPLTFARNGGVAGGLRPGAGQVSRWTSVDSDSRHNAMPCCVIQKMHAVRALPTPSILYKY